MKLESVKTFQELLQYFYLNTKDEFFGDVWLNNVGVKYVTREDYDPLYSHPQDDYERGFFAFMIKFEIQLDTKSRSPKIDEEDVQKWINPKKYSDLDSDFGFGDFNALEKMQRIYRIGLMYLKNIVEAGRANASKEVFEYYIKSNLEDIIEEYYNEWEVSQASTIYGILLDYCAFTFFDKYSDHYVWILNYSNQIAHKHELLEAKEKESGQSLSIYTLKWVSEKPLESVLDKFQPLNSLFSKSPSEGLKIALTAETLKEAENSLEPSFKNLLAVHFLIYHLIKQGFVADVPNMDGVVKVLTGKKTPYRKSKYKFENEDYALTRDKENLVLDTINSLSQ